MVNKPVCIDIYQGDNVQDYPGAPLGGFAKVKAQGIVFLIHKASEGTGERDRRYAARRPAWMTGEAITVTDVDGTPLRLKPRWGAYHFFHGVASGIASEAHNFLAAAQLGDGDAAFIDWENVGASGYAPSAIAADQFCCGVEDILGRSCLVYGGNVPREQLALRSVPSAVFDRFAKRRLWFCSYGLKPALVPGPWATNGIWLWQNDGDRYGAGPHSIPGIDGNCDNSTVVAPMTIQRLYDEWGK